MSTTPCIRRTGQGFTETLTFTDWADAIIQDRDAAEQIAQRMLHEAASYPYNEEHDAAYVEEFSVTDAEALRAQLATAREHDEA